LVGGANRGKSVFVIYPGEAHGFKDPAHTTDFLNRVGAFLDKYNPS
jgi:dipeptidyl aminopeptidase/acylaminoacyl peptidase